MSFLSWLRGRGDRQWLQTFSGVRYYPVAPRPEEVRIVDIAHHLSMLCRYTGACKRFYSTAEHSVLVSEAPPPDHIMLLLMHELKCPQEVARLFYGSLALERLLHDAPEFVLNDLNRPTKHTWWLWGYRQLEKRNWKAVAKKFKLSERMHWTTKWADNAVLMAEKKVLMLPLPSKPWLKEEPADVQIMCLPPEEAESLFLHRFYELTKGKGV